MDRVQVSRLGNPLVNEVVVPADLKDAFNALPPDKDATIAPVVARVKNPEVPQLIQAIYGVQAPATPRNDLVEIFLTGITTKAGGPIKADLNSQLQQRRRELQPVPPVGDAAAEPLGEANRESQPARRARAATCRASRTGAG